jgi:hypothetical protein
VATISMPPIIGMLTSVTTASMSLSRSAKTRFRSPPSDASIIS